ncbi:MAG TPA: ATP-binding protein [Oscillatoriales cyanobacterium M4454_W2019_049]|nr:ATP-binding protein [Oscillatoriales cyanobacterium M4454_W2019_049]
MPSIDQIIQREINPFDSTTLRPGNFWREEQDSQLTVNSIHQEAIDEIQQILSEISRDNRTRSLLLAGDSGSGKSYLLGRLKLTLNSQAFFTYIGPWPDSHFIWRHTLRNTVDSLMYVPEGQRESQLLLWLKSLSAFGDGGLKKQLLGERKLFIHNFKGTYPSGIYNPHEFFGILYALTDSELYPLACDWLKGDDLDEETLSLLRVKSSINSETKAQNILANFGRISTATQPIVLCFDNLDNVDRAENGAIDLQALFHVNSIIHNQKLKNFLVIVSIITNTWNQHSKHIQSADKARIDTQIRLRPIDLDRAERLWASRLYPLHRQAKPKPKSSIYPLDRQALEDKFPGGKALPRYVLMLGRQLFHTAKNEEVQPKKPITSVPQTTFSDPLAAFQLLWLKELRKVKAKINQIRDFSGPELMQMLRESLETLEVARIQPKLLPSPTYASYSLGYHVPIQPGQIGLIWTEEPNLVSFCHVMKTCQTALKKKMCQSIQLIRAERLGVPRNQGYQRYQKLFADDSHQHVVPDLDSVHYLATYHNLVNAARAGELILGDRPLDLSDLIDLVRQSGVLKKCALLQNLKVFWEDELQPNSSLENNENSQERDAIESILALVKTQQLIGRQVLIESTIAQFPELDTAQVDRLLEKAIENYPIQILDPTAPPDAQLLKFGSE